MKKSFILLLGAALLVACGAKPTVETEQTMLTKSYCLTDACNDSLYLSFEIEFPTLLDNQEALTAIQNDLKYRFFGDGYQSLSLHEAIDSYIAFSRDEYYANNRAYAERLQDADNEFAAVLSEEQVMIGRVLSLDADILSYEIEQYVYMGGAHGVNTRLFYNYNANTGALLSEEDVFIAGYEQPLADLLKQAMIEQSDDFSSREEFINAGFEFDSIVPNGNFYVSSDGITYVYNPYEIAAYAYGETEVLLDKESLKHLLKIKI